MLRRYTAHAENTVRTSAFGALMSTMRGCPALRGAVLFNMAAFLGSIPDEAALVRLQTCVLALLPCHCCLATAAWHLRALHLCFCRLLSMPAVDADGAVQAGACSA